MIVGNQIIDSDVYYIHYNVMTIDKYYLCKNICPSCWQHSSLILRTFLHTSLVFWSRLYLLYFLSVGEVTLFLQRWCGWNSSLEAILDVPETWKATTRNHSLLQRKTQQHNYSLGIRLNYLLVLLKCTSYLTYQPKSRSDMEIENENVPFLYKLVGTWAFSPHPK